jgi:hypothetical protein
MIRSRAGHRIAVKTEAQNADEAVVMNEKREDNRVTESMRTNRNECRASRTGCAMAISLVDSDRSDFWFALASGLSRATIEPDN